MTALTRSFAYIGHLTGAVPCLITNFDQYMVWDNSRQQVLLERVHLDQLLEQASRNGLGTAVAGAVSDEILVITGENGTQGEITKHQLPGRKTLLSFDARILAPIADPLFSAQSAWCQWVPVHTELIGYLDAFTREFPDGAVRLNRGYDACTTVQFQYGGIGWDAAVDAGDGEDYHLWNTPDGDTDTPIEAVFALPGGAALGPTDAAAWAKATLTAII
ncbi:hypothetical protein ABIB25_000941 [Nakamurella sp. UYEF19]|uniref:hypothetical protein n=1 Tax=Nakamurella sp. UYEF19 TaxID=1756392 RepID=UPI003395C97E